LGTERGLVAGNISFMIQDTAFNWTSTNTLARNSIPSRAHYIQDLQVIGALAILIVEKETVFHRLVQDGLLQELPVVLVTGKGCMFLPFTISPHFVCKIHANLTFVTFKIGIGGFTS
jgi:DNA topoisomerase VI subunit A